MTVFENLSIRYKLLFLATAPLLLALFFILAEVSKNYHALDAMHQPQSLGRLATTASDLVHEMQKERGFSAGFLGSKGKKFRLI